MASKYDYSAVEPLTDDPDRGFLQMEGDRATYKKAGPVARSKESRDSIPMPDAPVAKKLVQKASAKKRKLSESEIAEGIMRLEERARADKESLKEGPALRRVASGDPSTGYNTELTPEAESRYATWKENTSPHDSGEDYDLRGAYAEGVDRDGKGHLPDTYKKPNHETFSNESQYSRYEPESAGSWDGEHFSPPARKELPAWLTSYMARQR